MPATPPFGEHKLENKCHKDEQTVFSLTVGCSTSQCGPSGGLVIVSAGQQAAALGFTAAHSEGCCPVVQKSVSTNKRRDLRKAVCCWQLSLLLVGVCVCVCLCV